MTAFAERISSWGAAKVVAALGTVSGFNEHGSKALREVQAYDVGHEGTKKAIRCMQRRHNHDLDHDNAGQNDKSPREHPIAKRKVQEGERNDGGNRCND